MLNEEETRAQLVDPKLHESGWRDNMIERDRFITKGMIINENGDRLPPRKPDYILYYPDKSGVPIAVIEAEAESKSFSLTTCILDFKSKGIMASFKVITGTLQTMASTIGKP